MSGTITTQYPGVRYREHATRKLRNGQADRYFFIRHRITGKRVEEAIGWASEGWNAEKAHALLAKIKKNAKEGGPLTLAAMRAEAESRHRVQEAERQAEEARLISVDEFFKLHHLPHIKRHKRSWRTDDLRYYKRISPALGATPLAMVSRGDVEALRDALMDEGAAASTIKQYLGILSRMFDLAGDTLINGVPIFSGTKPTYRIKKPRELNEAERFLSAQEVWQLLSFTVRLKTADYNDAESLAAAVGINEEQAKRLLAKAGPHIRELHDCAVISLNTGLRAGEICRQRWADVDLRHKVITVPREDGRKTGGKVPMNDRAVKIYQARCERMGGQGLVFPPARGSSIEGMLSHGFRVVIDILGFNDGIAEGDRKNRVVFHTLRHTFASHLAMAGTDIYKIMKLMRHKRIEMTMRYAHLIPDATRGAVHNLDYSTGLEDF